jgi:hypothetical protein
MLTFGVVVLQNDETPVPVRSDALEARFHSLGLGQAGEGSGIGWPGRYICGGLVPAACPPSIGSTVPVTNEDWSEHSHSTVLATSAAVPTRRIGVASAAPR